MRNSSTFWYKFPFFSFAYTHYFISGFGTFSKNEEIEREKEKEKNKFNIEIEELGEDLENEEVKNVMGISEFGRKAKVFDIAVIKREFQKK